MKLDRSVRLWMSREVRLCLEARRPDLDSGTSSNGAPTRHWRNSPNAYPAARLLPPRLGACHTLTGYRSLNKLLAGRDRDSVGSLLTMLHEYKPDTSYRKFMPPLTGTPAEINALGGYLYYQESKGQPAPSPKPAAPTLKAQK
jgi:hypothetical protein